MATIKSYTDIEQSKELAEILPLDSADMFYVGHQSIINPKEWEYRDTPEIRHKYISFDNKRIFHPCWSLAALLGVLPNSIYDNTNEFSQLEFSKRSIAYHDLNDGIKIGSLKDNLVDACYEMIIKLHELKML